MSLSTRTRWIASRLAAAVVLASLSLAPAASPASSAAPAPTRPTAPEPTPRSTSRLPATVTLVTGDTVTLTPRTGKQPVVTIQPRGGSQAARSFVVKRRDGQVSVIPHDVARLVPTVLDPSLFDVTTLIQMGYDDQHTATLPLIVSRKPGAHPFSGPSRRLHATTALPSIHATGVTLDKADADAFGEALADVRRPRAQAMARALGGGISKIWLDAKVSAAHETPDQKDRDDYLTQIGAPAAWETGLDGSGVRVAVLDTGVDAGHPALAGQVVAERNFTDSDTVDDVFGHGTHVASLVAGSGAKSGGARQGIAPKADLLSAKVLGDDGRGQASSVIAGMQWAVSQGADIVNISLGAPTDAAGGPLVEALESLTAQTGTLFVVSAGDRGGWGLSPYTITTPGIAPSALTVGAVQPDDFLAIFSSEGPTAGGYRLKPDIAAPGTGIMGARAGARHGDFYVRKSSTTIATPIVTGGAALLMQQHPNWSWRQVEAALVGSAFVPPNQTAYSQGGGRIDLAAAVTQTLTADHQAIDFGYVKFPDDSVHRQTLTLTNSGDDPIHIDLTDKEFRYASQLDGDPEPAPAGALTAEPNTLTIPAGGSASTVISLDPSLLDGAIWYGALTAAATDGKQTLRLPIGFYDEPPRYDVHLKVLDRHGDPYAGGVVNMYAPDTTSMHSVTLDENGTATVRIPPGHYTVFTEVTTPPANGKPATFTMAGFSEVAVEHDRSITIDARDAVQLNAPTVAGQTTRPTVAAVGWTRASKSHVSLSDVAYLKPEAVAAGRIFITPTQPARFGRFTTMMRWRLEAGPTQSPGRKHSPDAYELLSDNPRFTNPLSPPLTSAEIAKMARVAQHDHALLEPGTATVGRAYYTTAYPIAVINYHKAPTPRTSVALVTASPDVFWSRCRTLPDDRINPLCNTFHHYRPGSSQTTESGSTLHPRVVVSRRSPTTMFLDVGLNDGDHWGKIHFDALQKTTLRLFGDGNLLGTRNDVFGYWTVPNEPGHFRLVQTWQTKPGALPVSRHAHTVWEFDSAPPTDPTQRASVTPPVMTLDYGAHVDCFGMAGPNTALALNLSVGHVPAAPGEPPRPEVTGATVWYSVNGGDTWVSAHSRRTGQRTFNAHVPARALEPGGTVSLRVHATDADNGSIQQTVIGMIPVHRAVDRGKQVTCPANAGPGQDAHGSE